MTTRSVLVTGASGFLGLAVCRGLVDSGKRVVGISHRAGPVFQHPNLNWIRVDLAAAAAEQELLRLDFDSVIHLAAVIPTETVSAEDAARRNHPMDELVFRVAASRRAPLVYASSSSIYGQRRGAATVSEDDFARPTNPYSQAKLDSERLGTETAKRRALRFVALRLCAPYGPGQRTRSVVHLFVENALANRPLGYYGTGTREQSFTYVSDAANAFILALGAGSGCYNIAGGSTITMRELALLIAEIAGVSNGLVRPIGQPDPQEGVTARFDIGRAAKELGWSPRLSLREGIARCMAARRAEQTT